MVASTWITPGCVQFLKNKKRFHTAWVKNGSDGATPSGSLHPPRPDIASAVGQVRKVPRGDIEGFT
jgi:hypothetical protein